MFVMFVDDGACTTFYMLIETIEEVKERVKEQMLFYEEALCYDILVCSVDPKLALLLDIETADAHCSDGIIVYDNLGVF